MCFRYRDYQHNQSYTTMTLAAGECIRRVLLHVLPPGFHRIRYYGFLGNRHRTEKLARCRQLLGTVSTPAPANEPQPPPDYRDRYEALTGVSLRRCPACQRGHMIRSSHSHGRARRSLIPPDPMSRTPAHTARTHAPGGRHGIGLPAPRYTRGQHPARGPNPAGAKAQTQLIPRVLARLTCGTGSFPTPASRPPVIQSP